MRPVVRKLVIAAVAGAAALAFIWRRLNPKTPLRYPLPRVPALPLTEPCLGGDANPTEGPVYIPNTPERRVIRDATTVGTPLTIHGRVLTQHREPIAGAVLDFWNCDANGVYDDVGSDRRDRHDPRFPFTRHRMPARTRRRP